MTDATPSTQVAADGADDASRRYCLISPVRDEDRFMRRTLDSVIAQTERPARWVIVDDGSTDETAAVLREYEAAHDFIQIVTRPNGGKRRVGPGVVEAFYTGYEAVEAERFPFIGKLDMDLELPPQYFELLLNGMQQNPRIGTCSGKPYYPAPGNSEGALGGPLISEKCGDEMSVGMTKFYRRTCFEEIGGFVSQVMWDGIDCHRCRMHGWIACSWDHPKLRFLHLRPMGSSDRGVWEGRRRHGAGQWYMGTGLIYMTASALYRMTRPPQIVGGAAMWWGYFRAMLSSKPQYEDARFRKFLRGYQMSCLWRGKAGATSHVNEQQSPIWIRSHGPLQPPATRSKAEAFAARSEASADAPGAAAGALGTAAGLAGAEPV